MRSQIRICISCSKVTEKKICRKCRIEKIVKLFEQGKVDFSTGDLKEITRYFTINPKQARVEVPEELRVLAMQNKYARSEVRKYEAW